MITNVSKGVCARRVQENRPACFVSWTENGEQHYVFFAIVSSMYTLYERLKKESNENLPH